MLYLFQASFNFPGVVLFFKAYLIHERMHLHLLPHIPAQFNLVYAWSLYITICVEDNLTPKYFSISHFYSPYILGGTVCAGFFYRDLTEIDHQYRVITKS